MLPHVYHEIGTVVGWGLTEENKIATTLNAARMPVATTHECLTSDRLFFGKLIYSKSFCAGFKNGTGVCNGDSGGGMFFQYKGQWYLKGVVSFSKIYDISRVCNLQQFVGFADASKFIGWIYENEPLNRSEDPILGHPNIRLINQGDCGKNNYSLGYPEEEKRRIKQYLWMAVLRHPFQDQQNVECNGVLINRNYVLTTNCVDWM